MVRTSHCPNGAPLNCVAGHAHAAGLSMTLWTDALTSAPSNVVCVPDREQGARRARGGMRRRACGRCCVRGYEPSPRLSPGQELSERLTGFPGAEEALRTLAESTIGPLRSGHP